MYITINFRRKLNKNEFESLGKIFEWRNFVEILIRLYIFDYEITFVRSNNRVLKRWR